ncbi:MAG: hypothetical protein ACT4P4_24825 [Betaproteobacteria bacterium]
MTEEQMRALAKAWDHAGPALEAVKRRELEAMTDEDARLAASDLLAFPLCPDLPLRPSSGLVDQQYWFSRSRSRR